jgi:hypothetical protein
MKKIPGWVWAFGGLLVLWWLRTNTVNSALNAQEYYG